MGRAHSLLAAYRPINVHSLVRAKTKPEAERVGKYMIRPLLALERLSFLEPYLEFIAQKLKNLARSHQIICITHLPQIASFAAVKKLSFEERVEEIARLMSGSLVTPAALDRARGAHSIPKIAVRK